MTQLKLKTKTLLCGLALASFIALPAQADFIGSKVTATAGTLGVGAEYSLSLLDTLGVRVSAQGGSGGFGFEAGGTDFDAKLSLASVGFQADFSPFGGFFASTGVFYNMNKVSLKSTTDTQVDVGGTQYNMTVTSKTKVRFRPFAPYVGGGIRMGILGIVDVAVEGGVLSHGTPIISTELTQINDAPDAIGSNMTIPTGLETDLINSVKSTVEKFTVYPVIKIAASIKF